MASKQAPSQSLTCKAATKREQIWRHDGLSARASNRNRQQGKHHWQASWTDVHPAMGTCYLGATAQPRNQPPTHLDIHASGEVQGHELVHCLGGQVLDVNQPLVQAHLHRRGGRE